jgi:hypothetical protein
LACGDVSAASGRGVTLAVSTLGRSLPQRWHGHDLFWWLSNLGVMSIEGDNAIGRRLRSQDSLIGADLAGLWQRVTRVDRIGGADGGYLVTDAG